MIELGENIFHDLVAHDILDPDRNQINPSMEGHRQDAGQKGPQRMMAVVPLRNLLNLQAIILMHVMII